MNPAPTGRLEGKDLILTRRFRAPIEDVWTSVTDSNSTARWFGPWKGEAAPGKTIDVQMSFEEGKPWTQARIDRCDAPRHLALTTLSDHGSWRLELTLVQQGDTTEMTFVHHVDDLPLVEHAGPGWEYYLDNLVAAREGRTLPQFAAYYPSQRPFYLGLTSGG
jgi:uncharacterized protein YndB with AHSA1/START domain